MIIDANELNNLSNLLIKQIAAGNSWLVYEPGLFHTELENAQFFKRNDEAKQYVADNVSDRDVFKLIAIRPLYNVIQELINADIKRNDIDYYVIDDIRLTPSRVLKSNPDQNPLYNPDGNELTDELIDHLEKQSQDSKMDRAMLLYPFIETDLSEYPIVELNKTGSKNSLVRTLAEEHLQLVTFEKTFVPADLIYEYFITERRYDDNFSSPGELKKAGTFKTIEEARTCFNNLKLTKEKEGGVSEIMLLGKYRDRMLEFNDEGKPMPNTGLLIDFDSVDGPFGTNSVGYLVDPNQSITVREKMFARFDVVSTKMVYYNSLTLKMKTPDKEFWNRESVSLKKKQHERESLEEKSLLSKARESNGKGMKR